MGVSFCKPGRKARSQGGKAEIEFSAVPGTQQMTSSDVVVRSSPCKRRARPESDKARRSRIFEHMHDPSVPISALADLPDDVLRST